MNVTLSLFAGAGAQFLDNNGNILSGGLIYTYGAGTTTPLATYTSNLGTDSHPNPIVLDSAGRIPGGEIWLSNGLGYKFVTKDSNGVLIGTYDNVPSSAQPPITNDASSIYYEQGLSTITAGSFVIGQTYLITSIGSTNFQLIGATSNTVGLHFIATGVGSGTGTAQLSITVQTTLRNIQTKLSTELINIEDFGAIGNGIADDTEAFTNFNIWAISQPANCSITLNFGIGKSYICSNGLWPLNINNLIVNGNGSSYKMVNGYINTANGVLSSSSVFIINSLINTTTIGSPIVITSASDSTLYSVGEMIMVASFDTQFLSMPPNYKYFEYHVIKSINTSTGVITLDDNVIYKHQSDFPYANNGTTSDGRARIYKIEQFSKFNINQIYNDIIFVQNNPNETEYVHCSGFKITMNRCTAQTFLPSQAGTVTLNQCINTSDCEPDKLVTNCIFNDCNFYGQINAATSITNFKMDNTTVSGVVNIQPTNIEINNSSLPSGMGQYSAYGFTENLTFKNSNTLYLPGSSLNYSQNNVIVLGSTGVTWSNPTLTLDLTISKNQYFVGQAFVGQRMTIASYSPALLAPTGVFGKITAITGSLNVAYITIQFSDSIAGTESLCILQEPFNTSIEDVNVNGTFANQDFCNWPSKNVNLNYSPATSAQSNFVPTLGVITNLTINVLRPYTGSTNGNIDLYIHSYYPYLGTRLSRYVDLTTPGKRIATLLGFTGWTGTNGESAGAVMDNGTFAATYPGNFEILFPTMASTSSTQMPIVTIEIEFDTPFNYHTFGQNLYI